MLFKKTVKAAFAAVLGVVGLSGGSPALAIDFGAAPTGTNAPLVYAAERLAPEPSGLYAIASASLEGNGTLDTLAGVINVAEPIFLRVDVGGVLRLSSGPAVTVAGGGPLTNQADPRDQFAIYQQVSRATAAAADIVNVDLDGHVVVTGLGNGTVRLRIYDDIRHAVNGRGETLYDESLTLVRVARSVTVTPVPQSQTATVASGFTQFRGGVGQDGPQGVPIAAFRIAVACHRDPNGDFLLSAAAGTPACDPATGVSAALASANVNIAGGAGGSGAMVAGDGGFAFAMPPGSLGFSTTAACTSPAAAGLPRGADGQNNYAGPASMSVTAAGTFYLCATVASDNMERIDAGDYTGSVNLVAATAGQPFPPVGMVDETVGAIDHDGTTVNLPYLTSYEGYVQRVVILNRNKQDVSYRLTFHTEAEGVADPMYHEGMLAGGASSVIKVADVVTFSDGRTRGSGTLDIVSSPKMVDVATTQLNISTGGTDTVVLHLGKRDENM